MNYKIVIKSEDITFELSEKEIEASISKHPYYGSIQLIDYLYDENGNMCGIKGAANLGHGYGFNNGFKEFALKFGETFSFEHEYTSIEGPSDWVDGSFDVEVKLIKSAD